jgi:hypothetical protein
MTTNVNVAVTPRAKQGNDVDCDISGGNVVNNAIWLPPGDDYDVTFTLVPDGGIGVTGWAPSPFANRNGKCPKAAGLNPPCSGFKLDPAGNPVINVDGRSGKAVVHYRLDFNGNGTCDPIIIIG